MYGQALCDEMKRTFDFTPIVETAVRDCGVQDELRARYLLDAFLQWFSLLPAVKPGQVYVMMKTEVDAIFHAFVLNTKVYREFCDRFIGHFIDHHPLDDSTRSRVEDGVRYTVNLLEEHFGGDLHPALREWKTQLDCSAWMVSCMWRGGMCGSDESMFQTTLGQLPNSAVIVH